MAGAQDTVLNEKITPTCRYGHGPLAQVTLNRTAGWAFTASREPGFNFVGILLQCRSCGYTEFFDDEYVANINLPPEALEL